MVFYVCGRLHNYLKYEITLVHHYRIYRYEQVGQSSGREELPRGHTKVLCWPDTVYVGFLGAAFLCEEYIVHSVK